MKTIFKSTLVALLLSVSSSANSSSNLPSLADVVNHIDEYLEHKTLYSKREDKKYSLLKFKEERSGQVPQQTRAEIVEIPLSPKYYQTFPWIGAYATYKIHPKGSEFVYFLTIAEVLNITEN